MDTRDPGADRGDTLAAEKTIRRLLEVGLAFLLTVPFAFALGAWLNDPILIVMGPYATGVAGLVCIILGEEKRRESRRM